MPPACSWVHPGREKVDANDCCGNCPISIFQYRGVIFSLACILDVHPLSVNKYTRVVVVRGEGMARFPILRILEFLVSEYICSRIIFYIFSTLVCRNILYFFYSCMLSTCMYRLFLYAFGEADLFLSWMERMDVSAFLFDSIRFAMHSLGGVAATKKRIRFDSIHGKRMNRVGVIAIHHDHQSTEWYPHGHESSLPPGSQRWRRKGVPSRHRALSASFETWAWTLRETIWGR